MRHNADDQLYAHTPVMLQEVLSFIDGMDMPGDALVVDCTMGEGGHGAHILQRWPGIRYMGFERDPRVLEVASKRLAPFGDRVTFINDNFRNIDIHLSGMEGEISFILYDFGISSFHFDRSGRGFSIKQDEPLDMRLDDSAQRSAADIVNESSENELTDIFSRYGEERWARRIARRVVEAREQEAVTTTERLARIVLGAIPKRFHVRNIHPATRVFQALRIAVNDELNAIDQSLVKALGFVKGGGRVTAISFHSLEDRIVKNRFRRWSKGCTCDAEPLHCQCTSGPLVKLLTKKPLVPTDEEMEANPRSRSAKMRACERTGREG